jgi:predicted metallo-beta-lactamase superfamily hydrolase
MNVIPLAADSLGVRSVATYVECGDTRIVIDPGASLGRSRFNLPPADAEWEALKRANDRVSAYATRATTIFVSHYHEDHFRYDPEIYRGKTVWAKDPKRMLGGTQGERAAKLWKGLHGGCRLDSAEGRRMETLDAVLSASSPLSHGPDGTGLGYVIALTVTDRREGFRFVHASDVQGPLSPVATAYLIRERPNLLYVSGPPAYLERELGSAVIDRGIANLSRVIDATGCRVIMDHHAVRDARYPERFRALWESGLVVTAAGFLGLADAPLESSRLDLWARRRKPPGRVANAPSERRARGEKRGARPGASNAPRRLRRAADGTGE